MTPTHWICGAILLVLFIYAGTANAYFMGPIVFDPMTEIDCEVVK